MRHGFQKVGSQARRVERAGPEASSRGRSVEGPCSLQRLVKLTLNLATASLSTGDARERRQETCRRPPHSAHSRSEARRPSPVRYRLRSPHVSV